MTNLLEVGFYKLRKSYIFWIINITSFALGLLAIFRYKDMNDIIYIDRIATEHIYLYAGIFIAFLVTTFIGKDYTDGIIRNKVISGNKRTHIYFANLIICIIAGVITETIYIATVLLFGKKLYGSLRLMNLLSVFLYPLLIIIVYCSIYNLITMLCAEVSKALVICVTLFVVLFVISMITEQKVYNDRYSINTQYNKQIDYLREKKSKINKLIRFINPIGQSSVIQAYGTEILDEPNEEELNIRKRNIKEVPFYSIFLILISNIGGIYLFKNQDLK